MVPKAFKNARKLAPKKLKLEWYKHKTVTPYGISAHFTIRPNKVSGNDVLILVVTDTTSSWHFIAKPSICLWDIILHIFANIYTYDSHDGLTRFIPTSLWCLCRNILCTFLLLVPFRLISISDEIISIITTKKCRFIQTGAMAKWRFLILHFVFFSRCFCLVLLICYTIS